MNYRCAKYFLIVLFIIFQNIGYSQQKNQLKDQFEFAQKVINGFEGYGINIGENDFTYHSLRNDKTDALLTRASDGNMAIEWETQALPKDFNAKSALFVWMAAMDITGKNNRFNVYVNGIKRFTIISGEATHWDLRNDDAKLEYITLYKDQHGDAHGYMALTAPKKWLTPGKAINIKIVGEANGENTWIIIYKISDVIPYLAKVSEYETWLDVTCEQRGETYVFDIAAPAQFGGKLLQYQIGTVKNTTELIEKNGTAKGQFTTRADIGNNLIVSDGKNRLVDVPDFTVESTHQTLLAQTILLNEISRDDKSFLIKTRRIYRPETVKSMIDLENSKLGDGTIYLMNSSHQDIAWMDSPEKCVIERDTMLLTPLINAAQKDPGYRFDIEDALILKEYIERHPDKEKTIKQLLLDGKISCGSTYTQPYEEMYSGEALARQFYFGALWLKERFGYKANTYWNVDVPGRTPQIPQIAKKAGTNNLIISRHKRGIFNWVAPDGSSVLTFSPGHYADAFTPLHKSFFEAAEYIASSSLDWASYFESSREPAVIPLLSDWDMSPAKDYSHIINQWENINLLEKDPGDFIPVQLPKIKITTAPEFMEEFGKRATVIPSLKGERPAVWLYIHGPSHQKALKASREGDILLTAAEKFATMDALAKKSFADYPQQRLNNAWEAKIYPDHGWGGKEGQITDDLFKWKYEFARNEAKQMIENSTRSIASHINTKNDAGVPVIVFNSLNWIRNDVVHATLNFEQGKATGIILKDDNNKKIDHQKEKITLFKDGSIKSIDFCFVAEDIPSLGYRTYYADLQEKNAKEEFTGNNSSFGNNFYKIEFSNDGLKSIFDKELNVEILNTEKFRGCDIFTMQSIGNGAGEFDNIQRPDMEGFDKTSNNNIKWENISNGPVYSSFRMRQQIRNSVVEQTITVYNQIKKIDINVALLNWDGVLYREYRMALPLNMNDGEVSYEVPYGVSVVGKNEIEGAAGERYKAPAVDIHPRGIENWIGASNSRFGVTLSSSVVAADYIDPTDNPAKNIILQPILLASRKSCHPEGNEYLQTGNHYFEFSLKSHLPGWGNGFRFGKEANEKLFVVVNPKQYKNAELPERKSFLTVNVDNIIISAFKKSENQNAVVVRMYDILGKSTNPEIRMDFKPLSCYKTSLIEEEIEELKHSENVIKIKVENYSIETFKFILQE